MMPTLSVSNLKERPFRSLNRSEVPGWLLFRSIRSAILLAEKELDTDLKVADIDEDVEIVDAYCSSYGFRKDSACNITLEVTLSRELDMHSLFENLHETATRSLHNDGDFCQISFDEESVKRTSSYDLQTFVSSRLVCRNLVFSESSRVLMVTAAENTDVISSLISFAENWTVPLHLSIVGAADQLSAATRAVHAAVRQSSACALIVPHHDSGNIVPHHDSGKGSIACSGGAAAEAGERRPLLHVHLTESAPKPACPNVRAPMPRPGSRPGERPASRPDPEPTACSVSQLLRAARAPLAAPGRHDYVLLLQGAELAACPVALGRLLQAVLALRRAFSLVRCGRRASCVLLDALDVPFWLDRLAAAAGGGPGPAGPADEALFHAAHGFNEPARRHFGDRGALVAYLPAAARSGPGGPRCGDALDALNGSDSDAPAAAGHEEELYRRGSGCVPEVDFLSPCGDAAKGVAALQRPDWFQRGPPPPPPADISVQVLGGGG